MNDQGVPDVYSLLFTQLPVALRWLLGVLTLGGFSLAAWVWRRQERYIEQTETKLHQRMDREMKYTHDRLDEIKYIHDRLDEITYQLIEIARNTNKGHD